MWKTCAQRGFVQGLSLRFRALLSRFFLSIVNQTVVTCVTTPCLIVFVSWLQCALRTLKHCMNFGILLYEFCKNNCKLYCVHAPWGSLQAAQCAIYVDGCWPVQLWKSHRLLTITTLAAGLSQLQWNFSWSHASELAAHQTNTLVASEYTCFPDARVHVVFNMLAVVCWNQHVEGSMWTIMLA